MKKLIVALLVLALPMSAMAMDAVTNAELDGVAGQAGVTIAFGSRTTTTIAFSQVAWGDPDGVTGGCGTAAGWLILNGSVTIEQVITCGDQLDLDIGTNAGAACAIGCVTIPAATTFIAIGLPSATMNITVPDTLVVGLGSTSQAITGTLGILNLQNLSIDAGTPDTLYIWAH